MNDLSPPEIAILRAALPIIQKLVSEGSRGKLQQGGEAGARSPFPTTLPRTHDGRHLSEEGVRTLHAFFEAGGTAYTAKKQFGLDYNAARGRYDKWVNARTKPA